MTMPHLMNCEHQADGWCLDCVGKLQAECEALRKDAERYRWMKREVKRIPPGWELIGWDEAIDAAMGKEKA